MTPAASPAAAAAALRGRSLSTALALVVSASSAASAASCGARAGGDTTPRAGGDARAFIDSIELCKTTEADLRARLGEPTRDGRLRSSRVLSWIVSDADVTAYLAVLLDAQGTVVDLYWDIPTEIPWSPADQCTAP